MKKKQFLWLFIAILLFAFTGWLGIRSAERERENSIAAIENFSKQFTGALMDQETSFDFPNAPFLARVDVEGSIIDSGSSALVSTGYNHQFLLDYIDQLIDCPDNMGIFLYMDSPGGSINESDELYLKLKDYKEATGRPIYCYFDSYACSGAYYVAMAADDICANRNSICVNIGVYISTYNMSELYEKLGVEQVVFKSSENKGIGMAGVPWTEEQKEIYQSIVDGYYAQFLDIVAEGRKMTPEEVRSRDDGREMLAAQALEAGFIDSIDRLENYQASILEKTGAEEIYEAESATDWLSELFNQLYSQRTLSDTQALLEFAESHSGIVVMAYDANY